MSRWVIVVLVPIGAVLIILSSLLRADSARLSDRALARLASGPGLASLLLITWALVSLLWTPVRVEAMEKLFKLLGVVLLGFFAVIALPNRMRATNLHLITIGVALGRRSFSWEASRSLWAHRCCGFRWQRQSAWSSS